MKTQNSIKLNKYVPVRKLLKASNQTNNGQKQTANNSFSGGKPTLPAAA